MNVRDYKYIAAMPTMPEITDGLIRRDQRAPIDGAGAQLAAAAFDILAGAVAHLGQHAAAMQVVNDFGDARGSGTLVIVSLQRIEWNQIEHGVFAFQQAQNFFQ